MMPGGAILATIQAGFEAGREFFKWLQTPTGVQWSTKVMADQAAWEKSWSDAGTKLAAFWKGLQS